MKRRSKLIFSLISLCFSIAVLCFGVYSALSVSYSISGSVSYEIQDVFVELDLSVYRALSTTPVNSATHNQNVSTIKDAGDTIPSGESGFSKLTQSQYSDHESTYEKGEVEPGNEDGIFEADSPNLALTYGSPTGNETQGYAFYIVIDIHNLGSEIINAQITAPTSLENTILRDSGNVEISSNGTEDDTKRIVLGLALDDVTKGITSAGFTYTIKISCGELPIELITDMTFAFNEEDKAATLTSYTGSDTVVEIPEKIGSIKQTTKTFGRYEDIDALSTSFTSTPTGMLDMFLVGDIYCTSSSDEQVTDKNQMIYSWMQDSKNASCTNITIKCQSRYTLTLTASDMENDVGVMMPYGPVAGYIVVAVSGDPTILDSMSMSYTIRLNNEEFYIDKNAVMQSIENNSGELAEYSISLQQILGSSMGKITISFEDIIYNYTATSGTEYTLKSIEDHTFYNCDGLTSIEIPSGVTSIGERAFDSCSALETVTFGENSQLKSIGSYAFDNCSKLTSIKIPSGVTSIGEEAFDSCSALETVTFGENSQLGSIGSYAFYNCDALTSIEIPSGVASIGERAFEGCSALKKVNITDIDAWAMIDFDFYSNPLNYGAGLYLNGELVTEVTLTTATKIEDHAFYSYDLLTSITIPSSVRSIGSYAFYYCTNLTSIKIPSGVTSIGGFAFYECDVLTSIDIPSSVTSIGDRAFEGCSALEKVNITDIDAWAMIDFYGYVSSLLSYGDLYLNGKLVTEVTLTTATKITDSAFFGYDKLTSITIPSSVTSIGNHAFNSCDALGTVTFEEDSKLESIGGYAFNSCRNLTSIEIPSGVKSIGEWAFSNCNALETVTFKDTTTEWTVTSNFDSTSNTITSQALKNPRAMASYLTSSYNNCTWTKKQSA